jgi:hypothetical protein
MANAVYPLYKGFLLTAAANVSLSVDTADDGPYVALVDTGTYTYSAAHDFYNDLSGVVGTDQRITSPTTASGVFDGADVTFSAVSGASVEALVIYRHNTGANSTWKLVLYEDTSVTGLPVTPNGGDIVVTFNAAGIFTISDANRKECIRKIGKFGRAEIFAFKYRGDKRERVGFLAQQVEQFAPKAVRYIDGCKRVNYAKVLELALAA